MIYEFEGAIDLNLLQFISLSEMYDRLAVNPDYLKEYQEGLVRTLGSPAPEKAFYIYKTATNGLPEEGLLLSQAQVVTLVKSFFERLCGMCITRGGGGYARVEEVKVKHISNPLTDFPKDSEGYYVVKSPEDIRLKPEDVTVFYSEVNREEATALYADITAADKASRDNAKEEKKVAKAARAQKKAAAGTPDLQVVRAETDTSTTE